MDLLKLLELILMIFLAWAVLAHFWEWDFQEHVSPLQRKAYTWQLTEEYKLICRMTNLLNRLLSHTNTIMSQRSWTKASSLPYFLIRAVSLQGRVCFRQLDIRFRCYISLVHLPLNNTEQYIILNCFLPMMPACLLLNLLGNNQP